MSLINSILVLSCLASIAYGAPRVLGGDDAPNHKYPYQVSLRHYVEGHFCSGSILNEAWILTAAHCVDSYEPKEYYITAGTNYLDDAGTIYRPQLVIMHEKYVIFYQFDIALIRVIGKITFDDFVKPIQLPNTDLTDYSYNGVFAGWGSTYLGGPAPNSLQEIGFNVITNEQCMKHQPINDRHICTYNQVHEGICHGDSGGPLVVDGVQVGIASFVTPCGVGQPDVYTRVFAYRDWIDRKLKRFAHIFL